MVESSEPEANGKTMKLFESAKLFIKSLTEGGDIEEVTKALSVSQKALDAYIFKYDTYNYPEMSDQISKLKKARVSLGEVHDALGTIKNTAEDLEALGGILAAAKVLNVDNAKSVGSEARAEAFGLLFHSAGSFMKKLPPPANAYAPILLESSTFFTNMHKRFSFGEGSVRSDAEDHRTLLREGN